MPIVDYVHKAEQARKFIFDRKDISEKNLDYLKEFLDAYDVSPARLALFLKHIGFLLAKTDDIKQCINDRNVVNRIFKELRQEISPAYYTTVVNVSLRFVRWLNDGDKPFGFRDVKNLGKKVQKRQLGEDDMITWEDGLEMCKLTNSIQMKAVIMTQLDGGFRPSEFVDLQYGDIQKEGKFFIVSVNAGKTGGRNVVLYKCAPYLQRWLTNHPTQKKTDPLWIMENSGKRRGEFKTGILEYGYFALAKRIRGIGKKAGIGKPLDFYNFRHSACRLAKLENLPTELAAEKFGHSVEYFVNTYARLSRKDVIDRHRKAYGEKIKAEKQERKPTLCSICDTVNEVGKETCEKCGNPLTLSTALKTESKKEKEIKKLKREVDRINKILMALVKESKIKE